MYKSYFTNKFHYCYFIKIAVFFLEMKKYIYNTVESMSQFCQIALFISWKLLDDYFFFKLNKFA